MKRQSYLKKFAARQYLLPAALFIGTSCLIFQLEYPLHQFNEWLLYFARLDPLTLLAYLGATRTMPDWAPLPFLLLTATAFFGRFFCGWLCPIGGMLGILKQMLHPLPSWLKPNISYLLSPRFFYALSTLRYCWLAIVILFFAAGNALFFIFTPLAFISHEITRLATGQIPWLLLSAIFLGIIFLPRFWCLYLCPSGILFSLVTKITPAIIKPSGRCHPDSGCGICYSVCPNDKISTSNKISKISKTSKTSKTNEISKSNKSNKSNVVNITRQPFSSADCFACGQCWAACPRDIIKWKRAIPNFSSKNKKHRREFILTMTGIAALAISPFSPKWLSAAQSTPPILRPPGAISEESFLAACARCARCIKVCPTECLVPMPITAGIINFETPRFIPRKGRCELCMLCPKVCTHGALADIAEHEVKLGIAVLDETTCLAVVENKLCLICAEQCPVQAVIIDENHKPHIDKEKCIGCGACENVCPLSDPAVIIKPVSNKDIL